MSSAISIATTGLTASEKQMDVIGNNLSNSNTLGFKASNTYFASMLNQSLSDSGSIQSGSGVAIAAIHTQFSQGSFENTSNATDLAIDGEGFFLVKDKEGAQYYTRSGAFHISNDGYLVDNNGYKVQGFAVASATADQELQSISLKNVQSTPRATSAVSTGANLDGGATAGTKFNVSQTVFDSLGTQHTLSTTYQRTEHAETWGYTVKLDDTLMSSGQSADGIVFDADGNIKNLFKGTLGATAVSTAVGTGASPGAATVDVAGDVTTAGSMVLTKSNDGTGAWKITSNGGYTDATVSESPAGTLNVDLAGTGTSFHFNIATAAGSWNSGDTLTAAMTTGPAAVSVTAAHRVVGTGAATGTLTRPGQIYQSTATPIVLTAVGNGSGIWKVTGNGGYANMTISTQTSNQISIDLDGQGGTDMNFAISTVANWKDGDTIQFDLTKADVATEDQVLQFSALPNGATIGTWDPTASKNKVTWALVSDTANIITGYASTSSVRSLSNDGYTSGVLKSLSVATTGIINGFFTNGQTSNLGQIGLASFPDSSGLKKVGNYFGATITSGQALVNAPGSNGLGEIQSNSLETSNTDTAKEFINMITAQRAYQSSAKVVTTADQMLQILMNIKQ